MEFMYLGTSSSEGYPAFFCECENCKKARETGGKNIRGRAQAIINGELLIDWNADTLSRINKYGFSFSRLKAVIITHTHIDHFFPADFKYRRPPYALCLEGKGKLDVYGSEDIKEPLLFAVNDNEDYGVNINVIKPFEPINIGDYKITALKANHGTENPYNYIIEHGGKTMLYAHDTGFFLEETKEYLKKSGVKFDFVSLDCTEGTSEIHYEHHMNIERNIITKQMLLDNKNVHENTKIVLSHFAHGGKNTLYEDMKRVGEQHGFGVAYDGMMVEI
jgi:phosphoribosyl 1,2-cyclic phosphate phosphodiesterase